MRSLVSGFAVLFMSCTMYAQAAGVSPAKPSFDCAKATHVTEKAVCTDATLAGLDSQLSATYEEVRRIVTDDKKKSMAADQKAWLKERNACGKDKQINACLGRVYEKRIAELKSISGDLAASAMPDETRQSVAPVDTSWTGRITDNLSAIDACLVLTPTIPAMVIGELDHEKDYVRVKTRGADGRVWSCSAAIEGASKATLSAAGSMKEIPAGTALFSRAPQPPYKNECVTTVKVVKDDTLIGWVSYLKTGCK